MFLRIAKTSERRDQDMNMKPHKSVSLLLVGLFALLPALAGAATLDRVRSSNTITLGYIPDLAPFSSDENGNVVGYAIEVCQRIAEKVQTGLGMSNMDVRFQAVSGEQAVAAITSGSIDLLCTPTPETLERRKSVSYSRPVYTAGLSVVVRKDASPELLRVLNGEVAHTGPTWRATINQGLANHTYATLEGGVTEQWVREQMRDLGVIATLVTVRSHEEGMQLVAAGKAHAFFAERMLLQNDVAKSKDAGQMMVLGRIFDFTPVSMALQRGDEDFRLVVDTVISEMYRSGEMDQLYRKHLGEQGEGSRLLTRVYALP